MSQRVPESEPPSPPGLSAEGVVRAAMQMLLGLLLLGFLFTLILSGSMLGIHEASESAAIQHTRTIELAMFSYAQDHDGNYPTGRSSTEVFQKLVDGNYVDDPSLFYLKMSDKSKPWSHFWSWTLSRHLTPKNVAYDVTGGMNLATPDDVPGVFATGYRIDYRPGGAAVPLKGEARPQACRDGLPICYHGNNAWYKVSRDPNGTVTNIISPDAALGPRTYTQLTPEGPLPAH